MATARYRLKAQSGWTTIYLRFKEGKKFDAEYSIGIRIPAERWSDTKQQVLPTHEVAFKEINQRLKELDTYINGQCSISVLAGNTIDSKWVKEKINIFLNRETNSEDVDKLIFFSNYVESFIKSAHTKKTKKNTTLKPRTIQHYQTSLNKILSFENFSGRRLKISDINLKFHSAFIDYLENEERLNPNTIGGYIDDIKMFCSVGDKKGIGFPNDYKLSDFYSPSNKTNDIYLTEEEINKIYECNFEQDYLNNAKDWFVIGLRTGFRVSDFLKLSKNNIKDGFIEKVTVKTEYPVILPIHDQVQSILDKRDGEFPRQISDQKFNTYIKEIARKAGLTQIVDGAKLIPLETSNTSKTVVHRKSHGKFPKYELVTSHICRRSLATNLYGKVDTLTLMKLTGHSTEAQFLNYIKITPREYAERLRAYWNSQQILKKNTENS
ncbi:MAG: integrase [Flavobacterium sp.]|uniref:phage integrase SAM-like domain-containing protein n=1 Tax=Flavobacterium sp. TaxID=239 RepID=UPI001221F592|nr:phage integrase SAM-like domain-containing protein [Flavobacterium sp.]RZJ66757.1 MAG: integrase [Flavobacterium sp.]